MSTVHYQVATVALIVVNVAFISPYMARAGELPSAEEARRMSAMLKISEEVIGKKTFTTSNFVIKATPVRVWGILTDYDGAARIFSNLTKSRLLSSSGPTKIVKFSARCVGNLFKVDYTLEVTERYLERIEWKRASGAFQANEGYWKLEPMENGQTTLVSYSKHLDGFLIGSQGLLKKLVRDSIPTIFAELKSAAESPRVVAGSPPSVADRVME
ncbi:MAG: SRPBCC family protein [Cyanobacteria bacterium]|nr:SRPBCC family protein [Cyanobacteriota bacterium]